MTSPVSFLIRPLAAAVMVSFVLERVLRPQDLYEVQPPDPVREKFAHLGVIISGRGPIWLYGYLAHNYHPCRFVAFHDPRLRVAVVVESHATDVRPGDLIHIDL